MPNGNLVKTREFFSGTFSQNYDLVNYPFDSQVGLDSAVVSFFLLTVFKVFYINFSVTTNQGDITMFSTPQETVVSETSGPFQWNKIMYVGLCVQWSYDDCQVHEWV